MPVESFGVVRKLILKTLFSSSLLTESRRAPVFLWTYNFATEFNSGMFSSLTRLNAFDMCSPYTV